jgi:hypothetical protein
MASQVEDIKWLPGGWPVMIDGFRFADGTRCSHYVLTHAHSDHTTGLRRRRFEHGHVFCTEVTAAAVLHDLALPSMPLSEYLAGAAAGGGAAPPSPPPFDPARPVVAVPLNVRFPLLRAREEEEEEEEGGEGGGVVYATFGDANHCPGAAIVVFEVPGRPYRGGRAAGGGGGRRQGASKASSAGPPSSSAGGGGGGASTDDTKRRPPLVVVHTGDMRFNAGKMAGPGTPLGTLLAQGRRVDALVLDTTYCAPRWRVPPQRDAIAALARALRSVAGGGGGGGGNGGGGGSGPPGQQQQQNALNNAGPHRVLVAFSAYHLGKERCFFGAARLLGWRVWLPPAKRRFMEALGELSPARGYAWRAALLAEHPWEAEVHVVGRGALTAAAATATAAQRRQQQQQQPQEQQASEGGAAGAAAAPDTNTNTANTGRGRRYRSQQQQMPLAEWLQAYLDQTNALLQKERQQWQPPPFAAANAAPPPHLRPFSRAAAVRASGWCHRPSGPGYSLYRPTPTTALVSASYSEHSSFDDLVACVGLLKPGRVIPTVGAETEAARRALVDSLAPHGVDLRRDRSRLDAYFAEGGVAAGGVARAAAAHARGRRGQGGDGEEGGDGAENRDPDLWEGEPWTGGDADAPGAEVDLARVDVEGQRRALEALERERERSRRPLSAAAKGKRPPGASAVAAAAGGGGAAAGANKRGGGGGGIRAFFAPKRAADGGGG